MLRSFRKPGKSKSRVTIDTGNQYPRQIRERQSSERTLEPPSPFGKSERRRIIMSPDQIKRLTDGDDPFNKLFTTEKLLD